MFRLQAAPEDDTIILVILLDISIHRGNRLSVGALGWFYFVDNLVPVYVGAGAVDYFSKNSLHFIHIVFSMGFLQPQCVQ